MRRVPSLGAAAVEIDLDDPTYLGAHDLEDYVARRLVAEREPGRPTPYRGRPELARTVAQAVAERARGVFLIARIVSNNLRNAAAPVDVHEPGWRERFPEEVGAAFDEFLDRFDRDERSPLGKRAATDLLRPLAFADGEGLPRDEVWATVASAVAGREYIDEDVGKALVAAGAFVVEATERGRSTYRLYHEALAEWLRKGFPMHWVHERIVDALLALVPGSGARGGRDWLRAPSYATTHLATHAAAAGRLDELVLDPFFLVVADHSRLLPTLPRVVTDDARRCARVYALALHHLASEAIGTRASYLELIARQSGADELAASTSVLPFPKPFSVPWADWAPITPHRVLGRHDSGISALAVGTFDGGSVIASGGMDGTLRIWDPADGIAICGPFRAHDQRRLLPGVTALVMGDLNGRGVIVSGGLDGTLRIWDIAAGTRIGELIRGHQVSTLAVAALEGRPVIVSGGSDGRCESLTSPTVLA